MTGTPDTPGTVATTPTTPTAALAAPEHEAQRRIRAALPPGTLPALVSLPGSDLQTLLIAVARARAARVTPADVVRRRRADRFVQPSASDPRALAAIEHRLWQLLPADVEGVELAPLVPLGTCSALGPVSQNRVVTTVRSSEVVSDSTNALAIEAALRRAGGPAAVHLAACQRQVRAQLFGPGAAAHFRLFALVSSARDAGSARTAAGLLLRHVRFWRHVLDRCVPSASPRVELTCFTDDPGGPALRERLDDLVLPAAAEPAAAEPAAAEPAAAADDDDGDGGGRVEVVEVAGRRSGAGYYAAAALRLAATGPDGEPVELGDGGLTTWTAQLTGNAKERCMVSCIATERLADLARHEEGP